jgi:hypothetical protein
MPPWIGFSGMVTFRKDGSFSTQLAALLRSSNTSTSSIDAEHMLAGSDPVKQLEYSRAVVKLEPFKNRDDGTGPDRRL